MSLTNNIMKIQKKISVIFKSLLNSLSLRFKNYRLLQFLYNNNYGQYFGLVVGYILNNDTHIFYEEYVYQVKILTVAKKDSLFKFIRHNRRYF